MFTQNINASKADYWQHRSVDSDVTLAADGSADVTLTVTVQNPSPPFTPPWTATSRDPAERPAVRLLHPLGRQRDRGLPAQGAEVQGQATIRGVPFKPIVRSVLDRPYFYRKVMLEPGGQASHGQYHVPNAATVDGDSLTYRPRPRPPGPRQPEAVNVTLHLPQGTA